MHAAINCGRLVVASPRLAFIATSTRSMSKADAGSTYSTDPNERPRQKLVILGTGWGSYSVLRNVKKSVYDVMVISPRNYYLFTPLLASTTVGTLEFRSIIEPVRNVGFRRADHFHLSHAIRLDTETRTVYCQSAVHPHNEYEVNYDRLVIGVGAISNTFSVPGVEEHAHFLKEIEDARKIRHTILSNFEQAVQPTTSKEERERLLHTVIVGGGPTGVEFGAELYDFVREDVSRLYKGEADEVRVTLVESNTILSSFDKRLQSYAEKKMRERENFNLIKSSVIAVDQRSITLKTGEFIPCGLVVWSTGLAPRPFVQNLNLPKSKHGQLLTDGHLAVEGCPKNEVFAIGDCSSIAGRPLPCTAQVAEQQGRYLAKYLSLGTSEEYPVFDYKGLGMLAYIGAYQALSDLPDFKLQGYTSWFLWRSAYMTRLGSWRLRMQVPMDWAKTFLFGRDTSRL